MPCKSSTGRLSTKIVSEAWESIIKECINWGDLISKGAVNTVQLCNISNSPWLN
jgi:hypothetical protein